MNRKSIFCVILLCVCLMSISPLKLAQGATSALLGWNNLGMHCMDSDYSVFSILPPYNTIEAQLIVNGSLVKNGAGYTVSYEAVADPDGSINSTSIGKGNWGLFSSILYGAPASNTADNGLAGWDMPGLANTPLLMKFENFNAPAAGVSTATNWFRAEGIPLTPYDDNGNKNPYPLMRLVARNASNTVIATSDIVLPVSDEMDCSACHASGSQSAAQPVAGWVFADNAARDYRLNILRLHDEHQASQNSALYGDALAAKGFDPAGLYVTVMAGTPILCATCHSSEALGTASFSSSNGTVPALTSSVHTKHAGVLDPTLNVTLNDSTNRNACYRCHPGSATRCLRGAMGSAIAPDGSMAMQCQSCHGSMTHVGSSSRVGWFMEPACQSCHTGVATNNNGQIRYASVFDASGQVRVPVDQTFATTPDTPATGLSLYRFSVGHGGLQCSACHGSTHAEFPTSHRNDNIRNVQLQGHAGVTVECTACHASMPTSPNGGPHGMHPIGQDWVNSHHDSLGTVGLASCQACHGTDYRGTVLSRVQGSRSFTTEFGNQSFYRGATVGCYTCHSGPTNDNANTSAAPSVADVASHTISEVPVSFTLPVSGKGAVVRIISQPANGTVGLNNNAATYFPFDGFSGTDTFTYAAYDGAKNSRLATGTITVVSAKAPVITQDPVAQTVTAGMAATMAVTSGGIAPLKYQWYKGGALIPDATGATLSIPMTVVADSGSYYVTVTNDFGTATSKAATLTVKKDLAKPVIATFTVPASSSSRTVSDIKLVASDNVSVTGYLITDSAKAPTASTSGWSSSAPTDFIVTTDGVKTLHAWVRDAAGNISAPKTAKVTVDTTAPVVSIFSAPTYSNKTTIRVKFTAADNLKVTGYLITESADTPDPAATNWTAVAPKTYFFANAGKKTIYAWVKDKTGNVSTAKSADVQIDTTPPTVDNFSANTPAKGVFIIPITFIASDVDGSGIAGYKVTESAAVPTVKAAGWQIDAPTSYTARKTAKAKTKNLYAWVKDKAGNVSVLGMPVSVTVTP